MAVGVEPDVEAHRIDEPGVVGSGDEIGCIGRCQRQGLLTHDVFAGSENSSHLIGVGVIRACDVDDVDLRIGGQRLDALVDPGQVGGIRLRLVMSGVEPTTPTTSTPMRRMASIWATPMKPTPTTPALISLRRMDGSLHCVAAMRVYSHDRPMTAGDREPTMAVGLELVPEENDEDDRPFDGTPFFAALRAVPACECASFVRDGRCSHTLSVAWWLQEQMGRHGVGGVFELFHEMQTDPVALGRELGRVRCCRLPMKPMRMCPTATTRLQWRIGLSDSRYYSPITITPYEQRPRKNGKGWTKGREVRSYDLLKRDFHEHPIDGEIAGLISTPDLQLRRASFRRVSRTCSGLSVIPMLLGMTAMRAACGSFPAS